MDIYKERLELAKTKYNLRLGTKLKVEQDDTTCVADLANLKLLADTDLKVSALLQKTAEEGRSKAKVYLETIVTNALKYISGYNYSFQIDIQELRGKPDADFFVISDINGVVSKQRPQDACGGGFVDIISTSLRYAYIQLFNNPVIGGFLQLDEPGKMISEQASVKFAEFVKELCNTFDKQTIMVTHNENLQSVADKCYVVMMSNDESVIIDSDYILPDVLPTNLEDIT